MDQIKIGEFLKSLRKEKKLTQQEAADSLYVSQKTISRWETGDGIPDISIIQEVAAFYGVSVDELLNGEKKNIQELNVKKENDSKSYGIKTVINKYLFSSIGVLLFTLLIGLILSLIFSDYTLFYIIGGIGFLLSIGIYLFGYYDNKDQINSVDTVLLKNKNLFFCDVYCISLLLYLIPILQVFLEELNYPILLIIIYILTIYFILRKIIVYKEKDIKIINKKISKILLLTQIYIIFSSVKYYFCYGGLCAVHPEHIFNLYFDKLIPNYTFRIIGGIGVLLGLLGMFVSFFKNKKIMSIISIVIGVLGNVIIYMDLYLFNWSYISKKELVITPIGIMFIVIYISLLIYYFIKNRKKV